MSAPAAARIPSLSATQRMQLWRFLRIGAIAAAGALVASGGHIVPSAIVGAVAGALETTLRSVNPAVPLRQAKPGDDEYAELGRIFSEYLEGQRPVTPEFRTELQAVAGDHPVPPPPDPPAPTSGP